MKQLDLVKEEWNKYTSYSVPTNTMDTIMTWKNILNHKTLAEMMNLTTPKLIVEKAQKWGAINHFMPNHNWNVDVLTADSFIELTVDGMETQFDSHIMKPYEKMLKGLYSYIGCYADDGDDRALDHLEGAYITISTYFRSRF